MQNKEKKVLTSGYNKLMKMKSQSLETNCHHRARKIFNLLLDVMLKIKKLLIPKKLLKELNIGLDLLVLAQR